MIQITSSTMSENWSLENKEAGKLLWQRGRTSRL
jgi:hypothetical protein